jgi:hypothetical protein
MALRVLNKRWSELSGEAAELFLVRHVLGTLLAIM